MISNVLTPLEIDYLQFRNKPRNIIEEAAKDCRLPITKAIINRDTETIINYIEDPEYTVENNLCRQTPLMLAAMLSDDEYVKLLLREAGMMDHDFNQAIDFTDNPMIQEILHEFGEIVIDKTI